MVYPILLRGSLIWGTTSDCLGPALPAERINIFWFAGKVKASPSLCIFGEYPPLGLAAELADADISMFAVCVCCLFS